MSDILYRAVPVSMWVSFAGHQGSSQCVCVCVCVRVRVCVCVCGGGVIVYNVTYKLYNFSYAGGHKLLLQ